jgi:GT2 family glycosyltransferase
VDLSIILVNWNTGHYLRECLPSVIAGVGELTAEIIVVDSASTRDNLDELAAEFPAVRFVRCTDNVGFGRANNIGAEASTGELILFLNPDTVVIGTAIHEMVRTIRSLPEAGIVGCKLLNSDGSVQLSAIQSFPTILNQMIATERLQRRVPGCRLWRLAPLFSNDVTPVLVEAVSGACLLIRRRVFDQIGGFSSEFFMYAEDVDLCCKAARRSWQTWLTRAATVLHHGGGSSRQRLVSSWSSVVQQHAKYVFVRKYRGFAYAAVFRGAIGVAATVRVICLALVTPFTKYRSEPLIAHSYSKWIAILRWSIGISDATRPVQIPAAKRNH